MFKVSRPMVAALATLAVVAGVYVGHPNLAGADAGDPVGPPPVDDVPVAPIAGPTSPQVIDDPALLVVGQILRLSFPARSDQARDLLRATVRFHAGDGTVLATQPFVVRLTGRDWRTAAVRVVVPDQTTSLEVSWQAVVGPVDVGDIAVAVLGSSVAQPPDES